MKDFIYGLYSNDNFTTYLVIALIVLVILFVIVLLFGKKDQKLEETKKLQKIELEKNITNNTENTFKEETSEPIKLESTEEVKKEIEPSVSDVIEKEENVNVITFEPKAKEMPTVETNTSNNEEEKVSLFESDEESPITINDLPSYSFDDNKMEEDLTELESIKKEIDNIKIPEVEESKKIEKPNPEVFSSVFVGDIKSNQTENVSQPKPAPIFSFDDDEEDTMELPSLK